MVRVLEVDRQARADQHVAEGPLGRPGVDPGCAADVPRPDGHRPRPVDSSPLEQRPRGVDLRVGPADQLAGRPGERQPPEPVEVHRLGDGEPGGDRLDALGRRGGLGGGEGVVLPGELERVHARTCAPAPVYGVGPPNPSAARTVTCTYQCL